ncbi:hypothetical protein [Georgenia subflava]|uniref:Cell division protein FtsL n=1 Tax=Georgenia subflava TaxID=1622177 RepID=A0A6N7EJ43_9MICO|nr:hypothetical protein [Georgenia subflava]MPV37083.1 hypothetical protein [Georgenia subflava]
MSSVPARAPRATAPRTTPAWRPRLEVVPSPSPARSLVPYLLLCAAILAAALLGVLLLNTQMAATAYEIHDQQRALNRLDESEASLLAQVEEAGSPAVLQSHADALGMVRAEDIRFVLLAERSILGGPEEDAG